MKKPTRLWIAAALLLPTGTLMAGTRPCRDEAGRVVACAKPRTASPRCKDENGRFAACPPERGVAGKPPKRDQHAR